MAAKVDMRRVTMVDIARLANVDISTVSRALAGSPRVKPETIERIQQIVSETGYVVNQGASGLRKSRASRVLMIIPNITNPSIPELVLGAEEVLQRNGYSLIIGITQYDAGREETLAQQFVSGDVDGVLLLTGVIPARLEGAPGFERRTVALSRRVLDARITSVVVDNAAATRGATEHLIELGHRRIAHLAGPQDNPTFQARAEGYRAAMRSAGLEELIRVSGSPAGFDVAAGRLALAELLAEEPPTAIIAAMDEMAMGGAQIARETGLSIPGDISIAGVGDIALSATYEPPLTTVRVPRRKMGQAAAEILLGALEDEPPAGGMVVLQPELILRRSTAAPQSQA